jgi:hypothetical protein
MKIKVKKTHLHLRFNSSSCCLLLASLGLRADRPGQNLGARVVVADLVAYDTRPNVHVRLTGDTELLAEVLFVPIACTETRPASAVVSEKVSSSVAAACRNVAAVEVGVEWVACYGANRGQSVAGKCTSLRWLPRGEGEARVGARRGDHGGRS